MATFWVIRRTGGRANGGNYVANPGHPFSYVRDVLRARRFTSLEDAERDACGNETPIKIEIRT